MTDTTAQIRSKKTGSTGLTEDLAHEMYTRKGAHYMAIVELKVEERHEKADGDKKVDLIITRLEPAVDETMAEHLRELSRVVYRNRAQYDGQATIDGELANERTVADVMAAGAAHKPHPFLPVDASEENPICDVCGKLFGVPVHSEQDTLPEGDDEEQESAEQDESDDADAAGDETEPELEDLDEQTTEQTTEQIDPDTGEPWEYPAPEGATVTDIRTVPDPFASPA